MKSWVLFFMVIPQLALFSQNKGILDSYIETGLQSNISLKQKQLDYEQSIQALKQARGYYWPEISINARYTRADGGRVIDLPVGDMLNPVYSTLNYLTGSAAFPQIENEEINFLRNREHETKVRLVQPLFNGEIYYNTKIKDQLTHYHQFSKNAYARELVSSIKTAYFSYLKALNLRSLLKNTKRILEENLRVNQKLFENEKVTYDHVLKARTAISEIEEKQAAATEKIQRARAGFNFLLNRELESEIKIDKKYDSIAQMIPKTGHDEENIHREEIKQAKSAVEAQNFNEKLEKSDYWPELSFVLDYGFQGKEYEFNHNQDFYIASFVLQWPIFQGFRRKAEIQEAKIQHRQSQLVLEKVKKQIQIEVSNAYYALNAAYKKYQATSRKLTSTRKTWEMIDKKYRQGMINQLEHMDAMEKYRNAQEQEAIARYDFYIKKAQLEKAAAQLNLKEKFNSYGK